MFGNARRWGIGAVALALLAGGLVRTLVADEDDEFVQELLAEADGIYLQRETAGRAEEAIELYEKILALEPACVGAYWRVARAYYWLGEVASNDEKKLAIYREGIDFAKLGRERDPRSPDCHFWLAVAYGKYAETDGILQSLYMVPFIEESLEKVIDIDPAYFRGAAYRVLGRLYHKLPSTHGGDNEKAIETIEKAIEVDPEGSPMTYRFLAEVYLDEGDDDRARRFLERALEVPAEPEYEPEWRLEQDRVRRLLEEL